MATFDEIVKKSNEMTNRIAEATGVSKVIASNVIQYSRCLAHPKEPELIGELMFMAQMGLRFGITSRYHVQLMFEAMRINKQYITVEEYAKAICIFLSPDLDIKINFVFRMYNLTKTGFISVPDISQLLKDSFLPFGDEDPNDQIKELIDMVLGIVDTNNDGQISLSEFRTFVKNDILCLELFGKVLPMESVINSFKTIIQNVPSHRIKLIFKDERKKALAEPDIASSREDLFPGVIMDTP